MTPDPFVPSLDDYQTQFERHFRDRRYRLGLKDGRVVVTVENVHSPSGYTTLTGLFADEWPSREAFLVESEALLRRLSGQKKGITKKLLTNGDAP